MKGADQVLAVRGVDGRLSAYGRIHLGQQGGGDLYEIDAALEDRGGEAGEIADDSAAEGDDQVTALQLQRQKRIAKPFEAGKAFGGFSRRDGDRVRPDAGGLQGLGELRAVHGVHGLVGDHGHPRLRQQWTDAPAGFIEEASADDDLIGASGQGDLGRAGHGLATSLWLRPAMMASTAVWWAA